MEEIKAVVFDFGGVLADEGFRMGLKAIGRKNGLDPDDFFRTADALIYETGYVTGKCDESEYWRALREKTGIKGSDEELRKEVLSRFVLRPEMFEWVEKIKSSGLTVAVLSDQTNWIEEINERRPFYGRFDHVFNSFRTGRSKKDPSVFLEIASVMGARPSEVLFIDDNKANVERALRAGLKAFHFGCRADFEKTMGNLLKL